MKKKIVMAKEKLDKKKLLFLFQKKEYLESVVIDRQRNNQFNKVKYYCYEELL